MENEQGQVYTVSEVSRMMGISAQTLRHYCNIGLLTPSHIDPNTGYRYFSYEQLHYADRARYLVKCGFSLSEIQKILYSNDLNLLIHALTEKKGEQLEKIKDAIDVLSLLDWYRDYFSSSISSGSNLTYCVKHLPKRSLIAIKWAPEYSFDRFYEQFSQVRQQELFSSVRLKRQFVSLWDIGAFLSDRFEQAYIGMVGFELINGVSDHLIELPEGDYYCYQSAVLDGEWNKEILKTILQGKPTPKRIITLELEDNLKSFQHCPHEVQILF